MSTLREVLILTGMATLASVGWYYGYRFLQLKNDILGVEWLFIGLSASCFFINRLGWSESAGHVTHFLDLFSRLVGIPIIGTLGVLQITHGWHFSRRQEVALFVIGLAASAAFLVSNTLQQALPVLFLVLGLAFLALCGFMAQQAFRRGLRWEGWLMVVSVLMNVGVALLQDFVKFEDDATAVLMNQLLIEHVVWSYGCAVMFYCYRAMHFHALGRRAA